MRIPERIILFTLVLFSVNVAYAENSCPPISTAIQQIGHVNLAAATELSTGGYLYTGASTYDGSTVNYYTMVQPTAVTPNHQIQLLEAALVAPKQLSSVNDTKLVCAYLGTATAPFDAVWQQAIIITTGSGPTPPPPPSGPKINVDVKFLFPTGVTPPATVDYVTLTDLGGNAYTTNNAATTGALITEVPTSMTDAVAYDVTAANAIVNATTYCADAATQSIPAGASTFSFQITYSTSACAIGPTPVPGVSLPGWPNYLAMGNITQSINEFVYTNKAGTPGQYLDANYSYATDGGGGSPGILIGPPDIAKSLGKNWYKVFYILHHKTSAAGRASPDVIRAVPVYYTTDAGSGGLKGNFENNPRMLNPCPYATCYCPQDYDKCTITDAQGKPIEPALLMSPGMLTTQYANLINFLALLRNEALRQNNLTASILYNPDLLGKMYQEGLTDPNINYWLDYHFGDLKLSLENAINEKTFPNGTLISIDPEAKKILLANLTQIENAMNEKGGETGRAYLSSINILTKTLLSAPNCTLAGVNKCQNITFGWHLNAWMAGGGANNLRTPGAGKTLGTAAATWLLGSGLFTGSFAPNFIAFDKYEADGLTSSALSNGYFWNWSTFDEYVDFISTIAHNLSPDPSKPIPLMLWQIPASHMPNAAETTTFPYQIGIEPQMAARIDNNTNYFFGNDYLDPADKLPSLRSGLSSTMNTSLAQVGAYVGVTPSTYLCGFGALPPCSAVTIAAAAGIRTDADLAHYTAGHLTNLAQAGVFAILWGGGDFTRTTSGFCPFAAPIGTDCSSAGTAPLVYNNDSGWLARVMSNYYVNPLIIKSVDTK
jgi:hypothetical protein